tara:strand:+ start:380 stop:892 length:513 start_codon:yes stop_codon:yes gene_type:complete
MESLYNFYNIDEAIGLWLDQIGAYLNLPRPFITTNLTFINDLSLMDDPNYLLDGNALAPDDVYKVYLKANIMKRNSRFTHEDIINLLLFATGAKKILLQEGDKVVDIYLIASDSGDQQRITSLLAFLDPTWFGLATGVGLGIFEVIILPPFTDIFLTDFSPMDSPEYVLI